jgi:iron complex outermembrane receptor protein
MSTGFRAPTLAEEFYTAVNVSPTSATVQLPANSAAAGLLGLPHLKPEISTSFSAGIVAHPLDDLAVTVDAYSISIGDRIVPSSTLYARGGTPLAPTLVSPAIAADGVVLDPTATQAGASAFLNGISTLTQGVDLTINYPTDFGDYGLVDWTLGANYNTTAVSRVQPTPAAILAAAPGATFFTDETNFNFVHSAPQEKIGLTANWTLDQFGFTLRETYYGPQHQYTSPNGCDTLDTCVADFQAGVGLTDLEARYNITEALQFSLGANNVFNIRPNRVGFSPNAYGPGEAAPSDGGNVIGDPVSAAFDPNGGYYYGRITYNF